MNLFSSLNFETSMCMTRLPRRTPRTRNRDTTCTHIPSAVKICRYPTWRFFLRGRPLSSR